MAEIGFVGQQQATRNGTASGAITFSLSDGTDATPATGDLVIIVVSSGRYPLHSDSYHAAISGYSNLTDLFTAESLLADFSWRAYYKFMGGTPDTTFTPTTVAETKARNAFQVMVFRGVDATIFGSTVEYFQGTGPSSYDPEDITTDAGVFDPGDIGGTSGNEHFTFASFALLSDAQDYVRPVVLGGQCTEAGAPESAGNMSVIFQVESSPATGARATRAHGLYADNIELPEVPVDPPDPTPPDDNITLRVWGFSLDNHDLAVFRLGQDDTLVFDLTTKQWAQWSSPGIDYWLPHKGLNWVGITDSVGFGSDVVCGTSTDGTLYILNPEYGLDEDSEGDPTSFIRRATGSLTVRGRDTVPCGALQLAASLGNPAETGATFTLRTSDDVGHTWTDHGTVTLTAGEYDEIVEWRGLGTARQPGRLFEFTDDGASVRLSGADLR